MEITEYDLFKKSSVPYALDRGAPQFSLIEVKNKKDQQFNLAIKQAQQEFQNLKQIAEVINQQAQQIKERLEVTEMIYHAEYNFIPIADSVYWVAKDLEKNIYMLCILGPNDWSTHPPENYKYISKVRFLANGLWEKLTD